MKDLSKFRFNQLLVLFFLICTVIHFSSCCECDDPTNPECSNYDPCHEFEMPKLNFGAGYIREYVGNEGFNNFFTDTIVYFDGDTIPASCTFYSNNINVDSFYWKVGQDPRIFRGQDFFLSFDKSFHFQPLEVELVELSTIGCSEGDFKRDTFTRTIIPNSDYSASLDKEYFNSAYKGTSTEFPNDTFNVEFDDIYKRIVNIPREGNVNGNQHNYFRDNDEVFFRGISSPVLWYGSAKLDIENRRHVEIRYKISYDNGITSAWHTFSGIRLD